MRPRTLVILTVLVAALLTFIWLYERELPSSEERAERAKRVFGGLEPDRIEAVEIAREGETVRLERRRPTGDDGVDGDEAEDGPEDEAAPREGRWRIVEPLDALADQGAVSRLVSSLVGLEKQRTLEDAAPGEVGLAEPRARVTLEAEDGVRRLEIGGEVPASSAMVVSTEDGVFVVPSHVWSDLAKDPGDWRSRDVFPGERGDIERVSLVSGEERVLLARRGEGYWIEAPLADRADEERVSQLLSAMTGLRVEEFHDQPEEPLAALGLEPAEGMVEAVLAGQAEPFRVALGQPVGEEGERRWMRAGGQLFEADTGLMEHVRRPAEEWQDRTWSGLEVYQIERVAIADGEGELELSRVEGEWKRGGDQIAFTPVSDLLYAVTDARADQVLSPSAARELGAALDAPEVTLTLTPEDGEPETLTLYPAIAGGVPAKASTREWVLLLPAAAVDEVRTELAEVRAAEPVEEEGEGESEPDAG